MSTLGREVMDRVLLDSFCLDKTNVSRRWYLLIFLAGLLFFTMVIVAALAGYPHFRWTWVGWDWLDSGEIVDKMASSEPKRDRSA